MDSIKAMVEAGMYNDFRTIYLLHDKRFMRLWFQDCFTSRCLSAEETVFLRSHAIPTWVPMEDSAPLGDYIREKDRYILKLWSDRGIQFLKGDHAQRCAVFSYCAL